MNIFETICKVMDEVGSVGKNKKNTSGNTFMYRGVDDVMNALNPAMVKNKLFIVPEVLEQIREDRTTNKGSNLIYSICKIKYTFYAEDGTNISAVVVGEAFDSGDKATNKSMSVAFKYACFQVFCIPTEEMKDPDSESHELVSDHTQQVTVPINRDELLGKFNLEIARTGKSLKWFLSEAKASEVKFVKNEKLEEFIDMLSKLPDKGVK